MVKAEGLARRLFDAWLDQLPSVAGTLTTALILFLVSLVFAPVRAWLFRPYDIDYPLICTAELTGDAATERRVVEFYLINRTGRGFTRDELQRRIDSELEGTGVSGRPTLQLTYDRTVGHIETAWADAPFNASKGEVRVSSTADTVRIDVEKVGPRAILRVNIELAEQGTKTRVMRSDYASIPFILDDIRDSCYGRS